MTDVTSQNVTMTDVPSQKVTSSLLVTMATVQQYVNTSLLDDGFSSRPTEILLPVLPLFGYPGSTFYVIHILAIISATVSLVSSGAVLFYMLWESHNPMGRPIGERLVFYLAVCDVMFSISRNSDHIYLLTNMAHLPDPWCAVAAFVTVTFFYTQMIVVLFTAVNAFAMVVLERKLSLGKFDWRLILVAFCVPCFLSALGSGLELLGPGPAWCYTDIRHQYGWNLAQALTIINMMAFIVVVLCYVFLWSKLKRTLATTAGKSSNKGANKYIRSAKMMLVFVAVYFAQIWPVFLYHVWSFIAIPPDSTAILMMAFVNAGGVFNALAYTVIRRKYAAVSDAQRQPSGGSTQSEVTKPAPSVKISTITKT